MLPPCEYPGGTNHSADRVDVYHGQPKPITVCGFHAQFVSPEFYERVEAARVAALDPRP